MSIAAPTVCRFHLRPPVTVCSTCRCGLCADCVRTGADGVAVVCVTCVDSEADETRRAELRRSDARRLRRAGYLVPREPGEALVARTGPLRLALPVAGGAALALAAGAMAAMLRLRFGIDVLLAGVALSPLVGRALRAMLGGVSLVGGGAAAAVAALVVPLGRWLAGDGVPGNLPGLGGRLGDGLESGWGPAGCVLIASLLAFGQAAGHRVARVGGRPGSGRAAV